MLSDEEIKAIERLNIYKEKIKDELYPTIDFEEEKALGVVLNLIEKQQKEIENNKKYIDLHYVPYEQYTSKLNELNKKWEDKIKAKIEPRLKELDEKMKKEWKEYGNSREYQDMEDEWNFLQSLLEKE